MGPQPGSYAGVMQRIARTSRRWRDGAVAGSTPRPATRSFYEAIVGTAVARIAGALDEAVDLGALAAEAGLSPLHFHRIFRGLVGETVLELHRRLRLERAATSLVRSEAPVTAIAFDAGYETHESFTRAFRDAFGRPPSEFRTRARTECSECAIWHGDWLTARCGIHFIETRDPEDISASLVLTVGGSTMQVEITSLPQQRVASVRHVGPYNLISEAFGRLGAIAGPAGLFGRPGAKMIAIYHDDPEAVPAAELRADAGVVVAGDGAIPSALVEIRIPAGRYARTLHVGPYDDLGDVWSRFMGGWLVENGHRVGDGPCYELYLNDPTTTAPKALKTELYCPIGLGAAVDGSSQAAGVERVERE